MSIGVSILLIVLAVLIITLGPQMNSGLWGLYSIIILLSIGASIVIYTKIRRTERRISSLPSEYVKVYVDAQELIGLSSMNRIMKKEIAAMILEIFEHASQENRDVDEVIDGNLDEYMEEFLNASGGEPTALYWFSYSSLLFTGYLLFIKLYKVIRLGGFNLNGFETETLDLGITITYAIISFVFFPLLMITLKKVAKEQWTGIKSMMALLPFIIPVGLLVLLMNGNETFREFVDQPFPIFNSIYTFILGIVVFIGFGFLMKYAQKKQLR
jgi:DNA-binding ferritin-like protein (Dps family)